MTKKMQNMEEMLDEQNRMMAMATSSGLNKPRQAPTNTNPLMPWFREPGVHLLLPTKGIFYNSDIVTLTMSNELEIYPMGAYDEMILKSADGLMNGDSIEKVILSCAPGVHRPRDLMVPDVDAIMLAIRYVTYGDDLEFETDCPKCKAENTYSASVQILLDTMVYIDNNFVVDFSDEVKIYIRPYDYASHIKTNLVTFDQQRTIRSLPDDISDEDRKKILEDSFKKIADLNFDLLASSIVKISIPGSEVTDTNHIREFLMKIPVKKTNIIQAAITEVNKIGIDREVDAICKECGHEWKTKVVYDPSHFFG